MHLPCTYQKRIVMMFIGEEKREDVTSTVCSRLARVVVYDVEILSTGERDAADTEQYLQHSAHTAQNVQVASVLGKT